MLKYHGLFRVLFSILFLGIASNAYAERTGGGSPNPIISLQAVLPSSFNVGAATSAQFTITNQIIPNVPASPGVASEVLDATLPAPAGILWTLGAAPSGCSIGRRRRNAESPLPIYSRSGCRGIGYRSGFDHPDGHCLRKFGLRGERVGAPCQWRQFHWIQHRRMSGVGCDQNRGCSVGRQW